MSQIKLNGADFAVNLHCMTMEDGALINLWSVSDNDSMKWVYEDFQLKLAANKDFCLNLHCDERKDGGTINLWTCNGADSQKWLIEDGQIKYKADPNFVLNLDCDKREEGAVLNLWTASGHQAQKFDFGAGGKVIDCRFPTTLSIEDGRLKIV